MKKILLIAFLCLQSSGFCAEVFLVDQHLIPVRPSSDTLPVSTVSKVLGRYKKEVDRLTRRVIGYCPRKMEAYTPESPLSNALVDALLEEAQSHCADKVDFALINIGGIRGLLPKGDLTVADVYRILPFDNKLVVLELSGADVFALMKRIAASRGEALSNVRMEVRKGKPVYLSVDGSAFNPDRVYRIATLDYLAEGNSGMGLLKKHLGLIDTGVMARDALVHRMEQLHAEGKPFVGAVDGRMRLVPDETVKRP
jgi:2',3'-cyclic-nucleotide 2'-phosphodiesterase (5'-nucleotidase family)